MKIAMLARNPELYSHRRLVEAAETRGHEIDIINTTQCYVNITAHRPVVKYKGEVLSGYDAVIPRIGASITYYGLAVLRQFEMMGVWPLNESVAIGRSRDKLRSLQILSREGLGLPVTGCANSAKQAEELGKRLPFSLVFSGPPELLAPQAIRTLRNAELGELSVFLVQLDQTADESLFEAVFT